MPKWFPFYLQKVKDSQYLRKRRRICTAAQNKAENGEAIDSVGELALLCEKEEGFIPTFYKGDPNDKVDKTLEDLKRYTYNLVVKEQGLGDLIESAL